jgi:hypothetical protein
VTDEQRAFWAAIGWPREAPKATEGQTAEQALAFTINAIRWSYRLEGLPVPSPRSVANELLG